MTLFDAAVIAILLASLLLGVWRGLVYEILSLAGWPAAFIASKLFAGDIAPLMPPLQEEARIALAYAAVFVVVLAVWSLLAWLLSSLVKAAGLGWADRVLGAVFGALRGALIVLALVWLAGLTALPEQPFWRTAQTSRVAENIALLTKGWLPGSIAQRIHYGVRS